MPSTALAFFSTPHSPSSPTRLWTTSELSLFTGSQPCMLASAMLTIKLLKMHRSVKGFTPEHYSLPTSAGDLALITAIGDSVELAYHKSRLGGTVTLLPTKVGASQCKICAVFPLSIIVFFLSVLFPFHFRSTPACVNLLRSSTSLT